MYTWNRAALPRREPAEKEVRWLARAFLFMFLFSDLDHEATESDRLTGREPPTMATPAQPLANGGPQIVSSKAL